MRMFRKNLLLTGASMLVLGVALTPAFAQSQQIETVTVTGRRAALESAVKIKENAAQIVDAIVADDAGKLPDQSITEVLQRVAGVTITHNGTGDPDHYSPDGSGVAIRGMTQISSTLNGRQSFSANGGRALLWEDVPPELMAAVNIYKSATADQIEGGVGGSVDLRTHMPFDFEGLKITGSAGENYGDFVMQGRPSGSIMVSDRWKTRYGDIGLLLDAAYSDITSRSDTIQVEPYFAHGNVPNETGVFYIPGGYDFRTSQFGRKRAGFYEALQWRPIDSLMIYQTAFVSYYHQDNHAYAFMGAGGSGMTLAQSHTTWSIPAHVWDNTNSLVQADALYNQNFIWWNPMNCAGGLCSLASPTTDADRGNNRTTDLTTGFEWTPQNRWTVKGAFQYVHSTSSTVSNSVSASTMQPAFGIDLRNSYPQVLVTDPSQLIVPSNYLWQSTMDHRQKNDGEMLAANADATYDLDAGMWRQLKFGARISVQKEKDRETPYNYQSLSPWYASGTHHYLNENAADVQLISFPNFFRGAASLPGAALFPSLSKVQLFDVTYFQNQYAAGTPVSNVAFSEKTTTYGMTRAFSAYAMADFAKESVLGMPMDGNIGVRLVWNDNSSRGFITQSPQTDIQLTVGGAKFTTGSLSLARAGGLVSWTALPSFNVQFMPADNLHVRFALSESMGQLSFGAMKAGGNLSASTVSSGGGAVVSGFTADTGNPSLKPQLSRNFDTSVEWYGSHPGDQAHIAGFYKSVKNYVSHGVVTQTFNVDLGPNGVLPEQALVTNYYNSPKETVIRGFEVGATKFFDFLPSIFNGLGADANFTYIDSRAPGDTSYDMLGRLISGMPVEGLSRYSYNAALMYERDPFSIRVAWTWRSKYLLTTNANGTSGTYSGTDNGVSCPANDYFHGGTGGNNVSGTCAYNLPIFNDPFGQLDAGLQYKFNDNISLSVDGQNLLNAQTITRMGYGDQQHKRSWFVSDRRFSIGLHFNY